MPNLFDDTPFDHLPSNMPYGSPGSGGLSIHDHDSSVNTNGILWGSDGKVTDANALHTNDADSD